MTNRKNVSFRPGDTVYAIARRRLVNKRGKGYTSHDPCDVVLYTARILEATLLENSQGRNVCRFTATAEEDGAFLLLEDLTEDTCFYIQATAETALAYYREHGLIRLGIDGEVITADGALGYLQSKRAKEATNCPVQLSGREIQPGDFIVENSSDSIVWMEHVLSDDDDGWNIYLTAQSNVDALFGTNVETDENDDYVNCYINVSADFSYINPIMDVILWQADDSCIEMERPLSKHEQAILLNVARAGMIQTLKHDYEISALSY